MKNSQRSRKPNLGVFHVSCWVLGLVAFVQFMAVGVAMAFRNQRAPEPEREVVKEYIMVPSSSREPVTVAIVPPKKPKPAPIMMEDDADLLADLGPVADVSEDEVVDMRPPVLDPVVEQLLKEAADARISSDLQLAHAKLSEAEMMDPKNPNVLYALGANFEALGVFEKASEYYMEVFKAGLSSGGSLYQKAGIKIARGWAADVENLASLGWSRMTNPARVEGGEKRTLILPVSVSPTKDFDPMLFKPRVRFYEEVDGKIGQAIIREGDSGSEWVTGEADWADGEEMAEVWYRVPDQDPATGLLFGQREFYGFVAELYYDGRLVDIMAQPRTLLREDGGESTMEELQREFDELDGLSIEDLTAGSTLLPKK
jgi:hypothetical protein